MNRVRDSVSMWRRHASLKRLPEDDGHLYDGLEGAVHRVLDEALLTGAIEPEEHGSLRAILRRSMEGEADASERVVLAETLIELRGHGSPLIGEHGERYRVLHKRLI